MLHTGRVFLHPADHQDPGVHPPFSSRALDYPSTPVCLRVLVPDPALIRDDLPPFYFGGRGGNRGADLRVIREGVLPPPSTVADPARDSSDEEDDPSASPSNDDDPGLDDHQVSATSAEAL